MKFLLFVTIILFGFLTTGCNSGSSDETPPAPQPITTPGDPYGKNDPELATVPHHRSEIPMLVILLEYNNQRIKESDFYWHNKIFGYSDGELNDYFDETSRGNFHFSTAKEIYGTENDGIIKVHLPKEHINTDIDSYTFLEILSQDLNKAMTEADRYINLGLYDRDANGAITPDELIVTFIMAGYEDAYEGYHVRNGIWGHQSCIPSSLTPILDGIEILGCATEGKYAVFGELHDITNPHPATIGIIAHEISHATFALPDLYNTQGSLGGIGIFGIMGAGIWTQKPGDLYPGETPSHFCAWSKYYMGWTQPVIVHGSNTLVTTARSDANIFIIPIDEKNYYLLENRGNFGYDRGLSSLGRDFQGGIALWHIDGTKLTPQYFRSNTVNTDPSAKGVDLVEAKDNILDTIPNVSGKATNLFYNPNVTSYLHYFSDVSPTGEVMHLIIE